MGEAGIGVGRRGIHTSHSCAKCAHEWGTRGFVVDAQTASVKKKKKQIPGGNDRKKGTNKCRSRSLRDDSQKGKGKTNGNDKSNGKSKYRDPSLHAG